LQEEPSLRFSDHTAGCHANRRAHALIAQRARDTKVVDANADETWVGLESQVRAAVCKTKTAPDSAQEKELCPSGRDICIL